VPVKTNISDNEYYISNYAPGAFIAAIYNFSFRFNLGLVYIPYDSYGFRTVLGRFFGEFFTILIVLIHIQSQQRSGLGCENMQDLEKFEMGLFRYLEHVVFGVQGTKIVKSQI
jgi:hypothetical protein